MKVPLCILIQRASPVGGIRLPKLPRWEKKPVVVTVPYRGRYDFKFPWQRKYLYKTYQGANAFRCRWCNLPVSEDTPHMHCSTSINLVLNKLLRENKCILCQTPVDYVRADHLYHGIPVCSDRCMLSWEMFNPRLFEAECFREKAKSETH